MVQRLLIGGLLEKKKTTSSLFESPTKVSSLKAQGLKAMDLCAIVTIIIYRLRPHTGYLLKHPIDAMSLTAYDSSDFPVQRNINHKFVSDKIIILLQIIVRVLQSIMQNYAERLPPMQGIKCTERR